MHNGSKQQGKNVLPETHFFDGRNFPVYLAIIKCLYLPLPDKCHSQLFPAVSYLVEDEMEGASADVLVGILIEITAILGLTFNGFGFLIALKNPFLKNSFGRLCLNHCVANFAANLLFVLWITPMTLTQNITLTTGLLGKIIGQINTFFCFVTIYSHVVVSLDRMMSIATPLRTGCFASCRRTCVLVSVPWILAFFSVLHFFAYDSCYRVYHPDRWFYSFADTECGRTMLTAHFVKDCIALTIMFVVDMVTLHYLRKRHTIIRRRSISDDAPQMSNTHKRIETCFFIQTVVQGLFFFLAQFNNHVFGPLSSGKLYKFFFITFQWVLFHTLDGLIMCIFQLNSYTAREKTPSTARIFMMSN